MTKYIAGKSSGMILEQPRKAAPVMEAQDIPELLNKGSLVLSREIQNLLLESAAGKLNAGSARDLVAYLKLLHELQREQENKLANLTDEELERLTNE
jgi:hypothetical protein